MNLPPQRCQNPTLRQSRQTVSRPVTSLFQRCASPGNGKRQIHPSSKGRSVMKCSALERPCPPPSRHTHFTLRSGFRISTSAKSLSLSVTTTHSCASAMDATIMSNPLRGLPAARPLDIRRAQTNAAISSNGKMRPANSDCGPSGPENHASS